MIAATTPLRVGAWVAAVGHGRGGIWSFNTGMVSNLYGAGDERLRAVGGGVAAAVIVGLLVGLSGTDPASASIGKVNGN